MSRKRAKHIHRIPDSIAEKERANYFSRAHLREEWDIYIYDCDIVNN